MKDRRENFAIPRRFQQPNEKHGEVVCLMCDNVYSTFKVLGPDNVYRELPHFCSKCEGVVKVKD